MEGLRLYPKSINIENVKTIKDLLYEFPEVKFDLDGKPIITKGILLTGSNFIGKTTFLQCLNLALRNDIGDQLKAEEAIADGAHEAKIDLVMVDADGGEYRTINTFERDIEGPVVHKWTFTTPKGSLKSHQSGALTRYKKIMGYHYISPNEIVILAQTAPGRRKLMKYFLHSVDDESRESYIKWDEKEQAHFEIRTEKHTHLMRKETLRDDLELSPEEMLALTPYNKMKADLIELNGKRDDIIKEITSYDNEYYKVYAKPPEVDRDLSYDPANCLVNRLEATDSKITRIKLNLEEKTKELSDLVIKSKALDTKFDGIITKLKEGVTDVTVKDYSLVLDNVKTAYNSLLTVDTDLTIKISNLNVNISTLQKEQLAAETDYTEIINLKDSILAKLPKEKPDTVSIDAEIETLISRIDKVKLIIDKRTKYSEAITEHTEAYTAWKEEDDLVKEAREAKTKIIEANNIEVEGFDFTPAGVTLNDNAFAERNISGADRRIAACQFTMAMNKTVMIGILEEMESLDEKQEQRIFKFAADRGFVVISDNVTKKIVDTVVIKNVDIL